MSDTDFYLRMPIEGIYLMMYIFYGGVILLILANCVENMKNLKIEVVWPDDCGVARKVKSAEGKARPDAGGS